MMLSMIIIVTEQLIRSTLIGSVFTKTMIDREQAEMLALGGINIAIAQLNRGFVAEHKEAKADKPSQEGLPGEQKIIDSDKGELTSMQEFIFNLVSHLNRWQIFNLNEAIDGVSGEIGICLSSEHGKINLNEAFDFKKQEFKKEYEALLKTLEIPGKIQLGEFHSRLVEFLKKRGKKIYDPSEIMNVEGFENLDVFYHPPQRPLKNKLAEPNKDLYLCDIFTLWTEDATLDPLVFSDALCAIFGIRRPLADDHQRMKEEFKKLAVSFKKDFGTDWEGNWKFLQPIYGEKPKVFGQLKDIFAKSFNSKVYSVISYGKINKIEQRLLAIIKSVDEQLPKDDKNKEADALKDPAASKQQLSEKESKGKDESGKKGHRFKIMKIYWL